MADYRTVINSLAPSIRWLLNGDFSEQNGSNTSAITGTEAYTTGLFPGLSGYQAADFDTTWYATPANDPRINAGDGYSFTKRTVSFFFEADDVTTERCIYEQGGGVNWFTIYVLGGYLYANIGSGSASQGYALAAVSTGTRYHVVVTLDLSDASTGIKIYIDGSLAASGAQTSGGSIPTHSGDINIGTGSSATRDHTGSQSVYSPYDGRLQDFAYWSEVVLDSDDVSALYLAAYNMPAIDLQIQTEVTVDPPATWDALDGTYATIDDASVSFDEGSLPALGLEHTLAADDAENAAQVSAPALGQIHALTADDAQNAGDVSSPAITHVQSLSPDDAENADEVSVPVLESGPTALTAEDAENAASVSVPVLAIEGEETETPAAPEYDWPTSWSIPDPDHYARQERNRKRVERETKDRIRRIKGKARKIGRRRSKALREATQELVQTASILAQDGVLGDAEFQDVMRLLDEAIRRQTDRRTAEAMFALSLALSMATANEDDMEVILLTMAA